MLPPCCQVALPATRDLKPQTVFLAAPPDTGSFSSENGHGEMSRSFEENGVVEDRESRGRERSDKNKQYCTESQGPNHRLFSLYVRNQKHILPTEPCLWRPCCGMAPVVGTVVAGPAGHASWPSPPSTRKIPGD